MGDPTITAINTFDIKRSTLTGGACREYWLRIPGLSGASACTSLALPIYYLLNPFQMDLVIMQALVVITTLDANDGDIDIGLGDDAAGTSDGAEICDSMVNTAAGVFEVLAPNAVACTTSRPIWKKPGTSTDSYLIVAQNADADLEALQWHLFLKVLPYEDLIGDEDTATTIPVA